MKYGWVLIVAACFAVYANSLGNAFHYDDEHSVEFNVNIRSLGNVPAFFTDPGMFSVDADKGMYRPLLLVSYALNFAYGKFDTAGYHAVNILIHAGNALLVMWIARLLGAAALTGLLAGLLFGVHPLAGEPVNYISSRSESLAALFYLAAFGLFMVSSQNGRRLAWGGSLACLALGLLSKEMVVTLPALLIAYDWLFIARRDLAAFGHAFIRRHAAYWSVVGVYFLIIWFNGFLPRSLGRPPREAWSQLLTQIKAAAYYLYVQIAPVKLTVEHQFFEQSQWHWGLVLPLGLIGSLAMGSVWLYRRRWDLPLFGLLWSGVVLAPVLVMPLNVYVNERRLYLVCAAFCLALAWTLSRLHLDPAHQRRYLVWTLAGICAFLSWQRNPIWADGMGLWTDSVQKAPLMPRPHLYLGNAYVKAAETSRDSVAVQRHWEAAKQAYSQVIALNSNRDLSLRALNNLGSIAFSLGDYSSAEAHYKKAVELDPTYADGLVNLGNINLLYARRASSPAQRRQRQHQAVEYYQKALAILPNHFQAHSNMALVFFDMLDFGRAEQALKQAERLSPNDPKVLFNLGRLALARGEQAADKQAIRAHFLTAQQYFNRAVQANPAFAMARQAAQDVARRLGQD